MIGYLPGSERRLLRAGLRVLQGLSLLRFGRGFHRLGPERARRLLGGLENAPLKPLRRLHHALKMLCQFAYFADEATWGPCGYGGPWLDRLDVAASAPPDLGSEV